MTLIIAAGNSDQFVQVSDRRLTTNGNVQDDESNKAIVFNCSNARMSVGFTGLAKVGSFSTRDWLLSTLNKCAPPDYVADEIIKRFTERATEEFNRNPQLKLLSGAQKRLSIMFTGYLYHHEPPLGALAIVSNFQNIDTNTKQACASDQFNYFLEKNVDLMTVILLCFFQLEHYLLFLNRKCRKLQNSLLNINQQRQ